LVLNSASFILLINILLYFCIKIN